MQGRRIGAWLIAVVWMGVLAWMAPEASGGEAAATGPDNKSRQDVRERSDSETPPETTVYQVKGLDGLTLTQRLNASLDKKHPMRFRWALQLAGRSVNRIWTAHPRVHYEYVLVETAENDLIAVNARTGEARWWVKLPAEILGDLFVSEYSVYMIIKDRLISLERYSGDLRYNIAMPFPVRAGPQALETKDTEPLVFVPGLDRTIYAMEIKTDIWPPEGGDQRLTRKDFTVTRRYPYIAWRFVASGTLSNSILYRDGKVFAADWDRRMYGLSLKNTESGQPAETWEYRARGPIVAGPIAEGPLVIFSGQDHIVYALSRRTGGLSWRYVAQERLEKSAQVARDPHMDRSYVLQKVGPKGVFVCLFNKTGQLIWEHPDAKDAVCTYSDQARKSAFRRVLVTVNEDNSFSGLAISAPDPRTAEEKEKDGFLGRPRPAVEVWRRPMGQFTNMAPQTQFPVVLCATEGGAVLCALEPRL